MSYSEFLPDSIKKYENLSLLIRIILKITDNRRKLDVIVSFRKC